MFRQNRGESLVAIIIAIAILAWLLVSITFFLFKSSEMRTEFESSYAMFLVKMNARTIAHNLDTKGIVENETFSIYRDDTTHNYIIFTGSLLESGAYILENGANITPEQVSTASGRVYRRIYLLERRDDSLGPKNEIIKWSVKEMIR